MSQDSQERIRAEAKRLLVAGVNGRAFPGGVAGVSVRDATGREEAITVAAGSLTNGGDRVQETCFYDLASLTHPFVAMAGIRLVDRGELNLDAAVETLLTDIRGGVIGKATLRQLFSHRGGLAPWGALYLDVPHDHGSPAARRWILAEASRRPGTAGIGGLEYSDLGFMIGGEAMARSVKSTIDELLDREILAPLGLQGQVCYPGALPSERKAVLVNRSAPTERCEWRGRVVRGEAHDENAVALGGVAGHSGLFGSAAGVLRFGRAVLDSWKGTSTFLSKTLLEEALGAQPDAGPWGFGWLKNELANGPCGRRMGKDAFGYLGLTGTSIFMDPERDVVVVLLTNRVYPSRSNEKIDGFRPAFHDGIMAALAGG